MYLDRARSDFLFFYLVDLMNLLFLDTLLNHTFMLGFCIIRQLINNDDVKISYALLKEICEALNNKVSNLFVLYEFNDYIDLAEIYSNNIYLYSIRYLYSLS